MPRWLGITFGLACALLMGMSVGTADAQDLSSSWRKARQACHTGQPTCDIKAGIAVSNNDNAVGAPGSLLSIYLSADATFDAGGDTLLTLVTIGPLAAGETRNVRTSFQLALGVSASGSFLIAVTDSGNSVGETNEANNIAVFADPGPTGVVIFDKLFGPENITIPVGTRVRWMHRDAGVDHTVTEGLCTDEAVNCVWNGGFRGGNGDTKNFLVDLDEFIVVFNTVGVFPYFCEKHTIDMIGQITVVP